MSIRKGKRGGSWILVILIAGLAIGYASAQTTGTQSQKTNQQQDIPDAPSAAKPAPAPNPFPGAPPATRPTPNDTQTPATAAPPAQVEPVPPGGAKSEPESERDQMYKIITNVNFVIVPVTVKDDSGRLVEGLVRRDFTVLEDGVAQPITFFTSDPFPLSAAVVLDVGMSDLAMRKVNESLPAIAGAFSPYDEVTLYTYGNTVTKEVDWSAITDKFSAAIKRIRKPGRTGGVPVDSGPMASGPTVNGRPFDPSTMHVPVYTRESHVLNDAILQAALDLSKRDRRRRKIIFVVSDGKEDGSRASYGDVLKVLLSHEITVYGIAVDSAAVQPFSPLEKVHAPGLGYGNILPKYASATGGQIFPEFSREAIETAYSAVTDEARNQYTIGYTTHATAAGNYRDIEVRVHRGNLRVTAKQGYYPLPSGQQ